MKPQRVKKYFFQAITEQAHVQCGLILGSNLFEACYPLDVSDFQDYCVTDVCYLADTDQIPAAVVIIAALAQKCALRGVVIPWTSDPDIAALYSKC